MEDRIEKDRSKLRERIAVALDRLRNDVEWLSGGDLEDVTEIRINIRIRGDSPTEIEVERDVMV